MAAQHPSDYEQSYERFHINFSPSDQLAEIISPFYKPQFREKAGRAVLRSAAYLDLGILPGRSHIYDPNDQGVNYIEKVHFYSTQLGRDVAKRSLAIVSFLETARNNSGDVRLHLKANVPPRDRMLISALDEFRIPPIKPVMDLHWVIPEQYLIEGDEGISSAYNETSKDLGLNHPAARALPEFKRIVDQKWVYVTGAALLSEGFYKS
jgi:hypothetical protein